MIHAVAIEEQHCSLFAECSIEAKMVYLNLILYLYNVMPYAFALPDEHTHWICGQF